MSIDRVSDTTWLHTFFAGDENDYHDLEATKDGLNIHYGTLPWDELDKARTIATKTPTIKRSTIIRVNAKEIAAAAEGCEWLDVEIFDNETTTEPVVIEHDEADHNP